MTIKLSLLILFGSQRLSLLQINFSHHLTAHIRHCQCYVSMFPTPGEDHDKGSISLLFSPTPFSLPLSLSLTHTLSLFSSRLKRLPKDRSKKMNWSQWVSWQQCAVFHKHYLDQQEKKVIIKAYKCSSVTSSKAQLTKFQWEDMPGPKARGS